MIPKIEINEQTQQFIEQNINADLRLLALNAKPSNDIDLTFALEQIDARQRAKSKIPSWHCNFDLIFPPSISMEQCSSEFTAKYKAELCNGDSFVDLTGGFGVDFAFISRNFKHAIYVERNEKLAQIAKHNFAVLGFDNIETHSANALAMLANAKNIDCIFIDPARRDAQNKKQILLENCEPNILEIQNLLLQKSKSILIKLSPLFDISELLRKLTCVSEIHIVSVQNECKELLVKMEKTAKQNHTKIICTDINKHQQNVFEFIFEEEKNENTNCVPMPQKYLYEPNAAICKSGGFKSLAVQFALNMMNINSKIYTSENKIENFCGRVFEIENVIAFNKNAMKNALADIEKANITVRNFPLSVADLRKRLKLSEGGEIYIFATTLADGKKVLIKCRKGI